SRRDLSPSCKRGTARSGIFRCRISDMGPCNRTARRPLGVACKCRTERRRSDRTSNRPYRPRGRPEPPSRATLTPRAKSVHYRRPGRLRAAWVRSRCCRRAFFAMDGTVLAARLSPCAVSPTRCGLLGRSSEEGVEVFFPIDLLFVHRREAREAVIVLLVAAKRR